MAQLEKERRTVEQTVRLKNAAEASVKQCEEEANAWAARELEKLNAEVARVHSREAELKEREKNLREEAKLTAEHVALVRDNQATEISSIKSSVEEIKERLTKKLPLSPPDDTAAVEPEKVHGEGDGVEAPKATIEQGAQEAAGGADVDAKGVEAVTNDQQLAMEISDDSGHRAPPAREYFTTRDGIKSAAEIAAAQQVATIPGDPMAVSYDYLGQQAAEPTYDIAEDEMSVSDDNLGAQPRPPSLHYAPQMEYEMDDEDGPSYLAVIAANSKADTPMSGMHTTPNAPRAPRFQRRDARTSRRDNFQVRGNNDDSARLEAAMDEVIADRTGSTNTPRRASGPYQARTKKPVPSGPHGRDVFSRSSRPSHLSRGAGARGGPGRNTRNGGVMQSIEGSRSGGSGRRSTAPSPQAGNGRRTTRYPPADNNNGFQAIITPHGIIDYDPTKDALLDSLFKPQERALPPGPSREYAGVAKRSSGRRRGGRRD